MELSSLLLITLAAVATAALSAVIGMAGGIVLLSVMLLFWEPLVAIPLHGAVQLVSNGSRTFVHRGDLHWGILSRYAILLIPAGFVGLEIARALPPEVARALIGVFVLIVTWAPRWLMVGTDPGRTNPKLRFFVLGGVTGLLAPTVGATGPLAAPFYLNLGLTRQAMIGTKAACQALGHAVKIALFGFFAGFSFLEFAQPLVVLSLAVVVGTALGSRVLHRVSETLFTHLYKGVLTLVALRLVLLG